MHYNTTRPPEGAYGWVIALGAEILISGALMMVMLSSLHSARLKQWTGAFVGLLLALFVVVEAPLSGMSLNPARTLGSGDRALPSPGGTGPSATLRVPPVGEWLVNVIWSEPVTGDPKADFDTTFSSLTFGFNPHKPAR